MERELKLLTTLAKQGDADKQYDLGYYLLNQENNDEEALYWFSKAAEQGNANAMYELGEMYSLGIGVEEDEEEAFDYYMMAAQAGHALAMYEVGYMYYVGSGVEEDEEEAYEWFDEAVEKIKSIEKFQNDTDLVKALNSALCNLRSMDRNYVLDDYEYDYKKAIEMGRMEEAIEIGEHYLHICRDLEMKWKGFKILMYVSECGSAKAEMSLAIFFMDAKLNELAYQLFSEVASGKIENSYKEINDARDYLGKMYELGLGVEKDIEEALEYYESMDDEYRSSDNKRRYGTLLCLMNRFKKALKYLSEAAMEGNADAKSFIGFLYYNGNGVEKDRRKALEIFMDADTPISHYYIGEIYRWGDGVDSDREEAIWYYELAAKEGVENAVEALQQMGRF